MAIAVGTAVAGIAGESLFERLKSEAPSADGESSRADDLLAGDDAERSPLTLLVYGIAARRSRRASPRWPTSLDRLDGIPHTTALGPDPVRRR